MRSRAQTLRPPARSKAAVTTAGFDLLTLRLLKQALHQLFCKISLPRLRGGEPESRADIAKINIATPSILRDCGARF